MVLNSFDDDDGVIHHQTDRQHETKERKSVDGKSERREERECANERNRHRDHGNQRRPPILQEHVDDQDHQRHCDQQRHHDFVYAFGHRKRGIERRVESQVGGNRCCSWAITLRAASAPHRVGARQEDGNNAARLSVEASTSS